MVVSVMVTGFIIELVPILGLSCHQYVNLSILIPTLEFR